MVTNKMTRLQIIAISFSIKKKGKEKQILPAFYRTALLWSVFDEVLR